MQRLLAMGGKMEIKDFAGIASALGKPLVLVGFVIFLFFGLMRGFLKPESVDNNPLIATSCVLFLFFSAILCWCVSV